MMEGYGLRLGSRMLFWVGLACVSAYITYTYWKKPKRRSINEDFKKKYRVEVTDKIQKRMLLVGLKDSGKTSLMKQIFITIQYDMNLTVRQKATENLTIIEDDSYCYNIYELANVIEVMPQMTYWNMFFHQDLIIFVIDSSDEEKLLLAIKLIKDVIYDPRLTKIPILIVASKQDHFHVLRPEQVKEALNLPSTLVHQRKIEVIGCQTKPLPKLPKEIYGSQYLYHRSVIAVKNKIFSMAA